jgi:hypothetical protein
MTQYPSVLRQGAGQLFGVQQAEQEATWPAKKLGQDGSWVSD